MLIQLESIFDLEILKSSQSVNQANENYASFDVSVLLNTEKL